MRNRDLKKADWMRWGHSSATATETPTRGYLKTAPVESEDASRTRANPCEYWQKRTNPGRSLSRGSSLTRRPRIDCDQFAGGTPTLPKLPERNRFELFKWRSQIDFDPHLVNSSC